MGNTSLKEQQKHDTTGAFALQLEDVAVEYTRDTDENEITHRDWTNQVKVNNVLVGKKDQIGRPAVGMEKIEWQKEFGAEWIPAQDTITPKERTNYANVVGINKSTA